MIAFDGQEIVGALGLDWLSTIGSARLAQHDWLSDGALRLFQQQGFARAVVVGRLKEQSAGAARLQVS
ncbi:MAG: hypothetical protein WBH99_00395 [Azovibrio sp.]|uniref:hypothetical protein n=1 Tax=Azovibrio sp. TaxID=1872673 RepID=UPI003C72C49F